MKTIIHYKDGWPKDGSAFSQRGAAVVYDDLLPNVNPEEGVLDLIDADNGVHECDIPLEGIVRVEFEP